MKAEGENKALGGPKDDKARGSSSAGASAPSGPQASSQARQLAKEQGIDLATVTGTGAGGSITAGDVRQVIEAKGRVE